MLAKIKLDRQRKWRYVLIVKGIRQKNVEKYGKVVW